MFKPQISISPVARQQIALKTIAAAGRNARRAIEQAGEEMLDEAQRLIDRDFQARSGDRRKADSQVHLRDTLEYEVIEGPEPGGFPFRLVLKAREDLIDDDLAKLIVLNFGRRKPGYVIQPRNPGGFLVFPELSEWGFDPPRIKQVSWETDDMRGKHFMERARDTVVARLRRRLRNL